MAVTATYRLTGVVSSSSADYFGNSSTNGKEHLTFNKNITSSGTVPNTNMQGFRVTAAKFYVPCQEVATSKYSGVIRFGSEDIGRSNTRQGQGPAENGVARKLTWTWSGTVYPNINNIIAATSFGFRDCSSSSTGRKFYCKSSYSNAYCEITYAYYYRCGDPSNVVAQGGLRSLSATWSLGASNTGDTISHQVCYNTSQTWNDSTTSNTSSTSASWTITTPGTYYVGVRAIGSDSGTHSPVWSNAAEVTINSAPNMPTLNWPAVSGAWTSSYYPYFKATGTDPDGNNIYYHFSMLNADGVEIWWKRLGPYASGTSCICRPGVTQTNQVAESGSIARDASTMLRVQCYDSNNAWGSYCAARWVGVYSTKPAVAKENTITIGQANSLKSRIDEEHRYYNGTYPTWTYSATQYQPIMLNFINNARTLVNNLPNSSIGQLSHVASATAASYNDVMSVI